MLSKFFHVSIASNGLEAVQIVEKNPRNFFDLILLDINMPIMNGLQACEKIQKYLNENLLASHIHQIMIPEDRNNKLRVSLKRNSSGYLSIADAFPLIYALSSEQCPEVLKKVEEMGFEDIIDQLKS